jgi:hypothetical protein
LVAVLLGLAKYWLRYEFSKLESLAHISDPNTEPVAHRCTKLSTKHAYNKARVAGEYIHHGQ